MCNFRDLSKSLGENLCSYCKKEKEEQPDYFYCLFPVVYPFNLCVFK